MTSSVQFSSVTQSCPTLQPHESQHARPPSPSPIPGVHWDSRPPSEWCHPVIPFSSCPQSLPASESFPMSQLFAWGGQTTGVSALTSFLPKKSQGWSPSEWTGWISLQSKGLSRVFTNTTVHKQQFFGPYGWCTGTAQSDGMGRDEGGGFRMGNTCIPVADSFWYLAKLIQLCKV